MRKITNPDAVVARYTAANGADMTDNEGSERPEAEISVSEVIEQVKTVGVLIPVANALLSDAPSVGALLAQQLPAMVRAKEEQQVLNGTGTGTQLTGVLQRAGIGSTITQTAPETRVDAILRAAAQLAQDVPGVVASHVALSPADYYAILGGKDRNDRYFATTIGSPFAPISAATIFGLVPVISSALATGTAVVYSAQFGATILRRQTLTLSISDQQRFSQSVSIVKCESRLGLATVRRKAFVPVTFA